MNVDKIIEILGGASFLSYKLKVHQITVLRWEKKGVPKKYWKDIIGLSKGRITAETLLNARVSKHA